MLDLKTFRKTKNLQEEGFTTSVIMMKTGISKTRYYKWCLTDEGTLIKHLQSRNKRDGVYYCKNKRDGVYYCDKRGTVLIAIIEPRFLLQ